MSDVCDFPSVSAGGDPVVPMSGAASGLRDIRYLHRSLGRRLHLGRAPTGQASDARQDRPGPSAQDIQGKNRFSVFSFQFLIVRVWFLDFWIFYFLFFPVVGFRLLFFRCPYSIFVFRFLVFDSGFG